MAEAMQLRMAQMFRRMGTPAMHMVLEEKQRLDPLDTKHGTYRLRLRAEQFAGDPPEPGDMLYVRWKNRKELVDQILELYGEDGTRQVKLLSFSSKFSPGEVIRCNLRDALTEHIEIDVASIRMLKFAGLKAAAMHNEDIHKAHMKFHRQLMRKKVSAHQHPVMDFKIYSLYSILTSLSKLPKLETLLGWQERISGRAYTMTGSQRDSNGNLLIDITVSEVYKQLLDAQGQKITSPARTSTFLTKMEIGDYCRGWILPELHKYPLSIGRKPKKLIAVATGSGISSPLSLLRSGKAIEPMWLIYGVRSWEQKSLYPEEIQAFVDSGAICRLDVAESRPQKEGKSKQYVQDVLWQQRQQIVADILDGAHVYLCGRLSMGHQVRDVMIRMFLDQNAAETPEQARELFESYVDKLVFQASVSGV